MGEQSRPATQWTNHAAPKIQQRGDEPRQLPHLIRWRFAFNYRKVDQQLVARHFLTGMGRGEGHDDIRAQSNGDPGG
jgi:hypothetical protein